MGQAFVAGALAIAVTCGPISLDTSNNGRQAASGDCVVGVEGPVGGERKGVGVLGGEGDHVAFLIAGAVEFAFA